MGILIVLTGQCKWTGGKVSGHDVEVLLGRDHLLPAYSDRYYCYFSKSGYSESASRLAKENGRVHLVTLGDLFSRMK